MKPMCFFFHGQHGQRNSSRASPTTTAVVSHQYGDLSYPSLNWIFLAPQRNSEARNKARNRRGTRLVQFCDFADVKQRNLPAN